MKLQHQIEVAASADEVWTFLQDTHAVAGCLPGAELVDELGDDRYQGRVRVAVGPLRMNYVGDVSIVERDAEAHRMTLDAAGRDKRGSGAVQAHVWLQVSPTANGSQLEVVSDVDLSGRIASLGRGVRDVSNRMFVEFAEQLSDRIAHPETGASTEATEAPAPAPLPSDRTAATTPTTTTAPEQQVATDRARQAGELKVMSLVWTVTRERIADLLEKLSVRIRPR